MTTEEEVDKGGESKRQFQCVCWKLEPRLTLLSSVSGEFNPHINWLLQKLGFKHAQTTIPKWVQRGVMDPLDKTVALAVEQLMQFSGKKKLKFLANSPK
ncbi:Transmembrane protein KIAA1109 [Geodia barretti]|nr:Transmembrane protein KIAA1109 [Geodia barretti]